MKTTLILAAICAAIATCADAASAPASGTYAANIFITNADYGCIDNGAATYIGEFSFAGLTGTTHYLRVPISTGDDAITSVQTLTVTHGKGTTSLSGKLAWLGTGFNGSGWNVAGTWSATVTEVGARAFLIQTKESYTGCTEEDANISLVRIGVNQ